MEKIKVKCQYCGKEVERFKHVYFGAMKMKATCFNCKMERNRKNALRISKLKYGKIKNT